MPRYPKDDGVVHVIHIPEIQPGPWCQECLEVQLVQLSHVVHVCRELQEDLFFLITCFFCAMFFFVSQAIILGAFGGSKQNHDHDNLYNHDHHHYLEDIHIHQGLADLELSSQGGGTRRFSG